MRILLCNDDGIDSPLLHWLCQAADARGHAVTVVAPSTQQSGKSQAFTCFEPLRVHARTLTGAVAAYAVDGTPTDCARLGIMALMPECPELVISGMNAGWNAGLATYVSGTVGAAREAAFQGVRSLAVSVSDCSPEDTSRAFADWAVRLGERVRRAELPALGVVNVNAPEVAADALGKAVMCELSLKRYKDGYTRTDSPRGGAWYWTSPMADDEAPEAGSDLAALLQGCISCTVLTPRPCNQALYAGLLTDA